MTLETLLDQCDAQQNDLRADNFGVDPATGQVMVLDLEDITIGPTSTAGISSRESYRHKINAYMR